MSVEQLSRSWRWPWQQPSRNDASTIMGMQSIGVYLLVGGILAVYLFVGLNAGGAEMPGLYLISMLLISIIVVVLLAAPADPMVWWATAITTIGPVIALALALPGLSARPGMAYATLTGALALILAFTCVRGRVWAAWGGYALSVIVTMGFGPQPALMISVLPNLAVMVMASFFATVVRPRARQIYNLQRQAEQRAAAEAAELAVLAERNQQLAYLNDQARPLLELIAAGQLDAEPVTADSTLVAAALRDRIRAPRLDRPEMAAAAHRARLRGVRVVLLDDYGAGPDTPAGVNTLVEQTVQILDSLPAGVDATVRVLPRGRSRLATIVADSADGVQRWEFSPDGHCLQPLS